MDEHAERTSGVINIEKLRAQALEGLHRTAEQAGAERGFQEGAAFVLGGLGCDSFSEAHRLIELGRWADPFSPDNHDGRLRRRQKEG